MKIARSDDLVLSESNNLKLIKRNKGLEFNYVLETKIGKSPWVYLRTIERPQNTFLARLFLSKYVNDDKYETHAKNIFWEWLDTIDTYSSLR